ncbi:NAD-dependent epimerase/dehydratase family protein [Trinickia sp.]|uniref:NAD-dependent epimerase/dehydratase family protein n=1 Tax=Trinickia sp. TaxID=2571163 RepID=UPI003F7DA602
MHDIAPGFSLFRDDLEHVDRELARVWPDLRGAHLFLTGATGFFGIWLLESLIWANRARDLDLTITALSRAPERFLSTQAPHLRDRNELRFVTGDAASFEIPSRRCTHIMHAASENNVDGRPDWPERHLNAAIDGTRRIVDMAARHACESVLLTSSGAVYSTVEANAGPRFEEGPAGIADYASERHVYRESKRLMEVMTAIGAQQHGFKAAIARCFAFVGPYLPLGHNYAAGNLIRDALSGKEIVVTGDGTPLRSYLYAADLVVWLLTILVRGRSGVPYNVGGEHAVSIAELAHRVAAQAGMPADAVTIKREPIPGAAPSAYLPSLLRAKEELGLRPAIALDDAIVRTLAWYRRRMDTS